MSTWPTHKQMVRVKTDIESFLTPVWIQRNSFLCIDYSPDNFPQMLNPPGHKRRPLPSDLEPSLRRRPPCHCDPWRQPTWCPSPDHWQRSLWYCEICRMRPWLYGTHRPRFLAQWSFPFARYSRFQHWFQLDRRRMFCIWKLCWSKHFGTCRQKRQPADLKLTIVNLYVYNSSNLSFRSFYI